MVRPLTIPCGPLAAQLLGDRACPPPQSCWGQSMVRQHGPIDSLQLTLLTDRQDNDAPLTGSLSTTRRCSVASECPFVSIGPACPSTLTTLQQQCGDEEKGEGVGVVSSHAFLTVGIFKGMLQDRRQAGRRRRKSCRADPQQLQQVVESQSGEEVAQRRV